jgi:3-oxoadipate enol-lactonase
MSVAVHYRLQGPRAAPALVLAGSLGTSLEMWDDQVSALSRRFRLISYDQRGHGRSPAPPGPYSIAELGEDLLTLLDRLELERTSLCGTSIGGMTAMWIAVHAPERLERLVLCSTSAHLPPGDAWLERAATVRERGTAALAETVVSRWFTPGMATQRPDVVARLRRQLLDTSAEGYAGCCEAIAAFDLRDEISMIRAPTLVLAGERDPAIPPEHGRLVSETVPSARFQLVPDAAHLPNVERPELITEALLEHLAAEARA